MAADLVGRHNLLKGKDEIMRTILLQALVLLFAASSFADVTLPHILGNNMVLQSDAPIKIWGMADPGENVTVSFIF